MIARDAASGLVSSIAAAFIAAAFVLGGAGFAQVNPVPPFVGSSSESFEGPLQSAAACVAPGVFAGQGDLCTPGNAFCYVLGNLGGGCSIDPHAGLQLFAGRGPLELHFDGSATSFGGWFAHPLTVQTPADHFDFYDSNDVLLASFTLQIPYDCTWTWLGWSTTSGVSIRRVVINAGITPGAWLALDDLHADLVSPPFVYCTSGTSSNGCNASIAATSNPDVAHALPCALTVSGVEGAKSGIVFYSLQALPQPWCSGGSSFLCVKPPTMRTGTQSSGGNAGSCNGALVLDWNAFQLATPGALGAPWLAGAKAHVQGWFRDPPSCKTTALSNAIELTYQP